MMLGRDLLWQTYLQKLKCMISKCTSKLLFIYSSENTTVEGSSYKVSVKDDVYTAVPEVNNSYLI